MEILTGFLIAVVIALTGVGAGTITAPMLILFLHVPADVAVGTALAYSAVVKVIVAPIQILRRQVNYRMLGYMMLGGVPGVILGSLLFRRFVLRGYSGPLYWVLGAIMVFTSGWHLYRHFRPRAVSSAQTDRPRWIAALMLPIGAEVGFSSSGAGALGTVALLSLSSLPATQIVGTDIVFGLGVAIVGSGVHMLGGTYNSALLIKMIIGGIAGAIVGSSIAPHVPNRQLRFALSVWLLVIGVEFCYRAVRL
jgi:uncharacterized protein